MSTPGRTFNGAAGDDIVRYMVKSVNPAGAYRTRSTVLVGRPRYTILGRTKRVRVDEPTAIMKRAGAAVLAGSPELESEDLAAAVWHAMAAKRRK